MMLNEKIINGVGVYGEPYYFNEKNYYSLRELAGAFSASNKNWEDAIFQLKNGGVEKWLEISGEYDASKKINKILSENEKDEDLALINVIYSFAPEIPFAVYGKAIDFETLYSIIKNYNKKIVPDDEKKIVKILNEDCRLLDYYKAYFNATLTTPESKLYSTLINIKRAGIRVSKKLSAIMERIVNHDIYVIPERFKGVFCDWCDFVFKNHNLIFSSRKYENLLKQGCIPEGVMSGVKEALSNPAASCEFIEAELGILRNFFKNSSFLMTKEEFEAIVAIFPKLCKIDNYADYQSLLNIFGKCYLQGIRLDGEFFGEITRKYFIPEEALKSALPCRIIPFINYMVSIEKNDRKLTIENYEYFLNNYYFIPRNIYKDLNGDDFDKFMKALEFAGLIISNIAYVKIETAALFKDDSDEWSIEELCAVKYCVDKNISAEIFKKAVKDISSKGRTTEKLKMAVIKQMNRTRLFRAAKKYFAVFIVLAASAYYFLWFQLYSVRSSAGVLAARNFFGYYGIISNGKWIAGPEFDWIGRFDSKSGLAFFGIKRKYGVINREGRVMLKPEFDYAGEFNREGLAEVRRNFKCGYITRELKIIMQPVYDSVFLFDETGPIRIGLDGKYGLADKSGKVLAQPSFDRIDRYYGAAEGVFKITLNGKKGLIGADGRIIIKPLYDEVISYKKNSLSIIKLGGKLGCVNEEGKLTLEPLYDKIVDFYYKEQKTAKIMLNGKEGLINRKGEILIKPLYDYIDDFQSGNVGVMKLNGKYGLIDDRGKSLSARLFDYISIDHRHNVAIIKQMKKYGLMDMNGNVFLEPFYDHIDSFNSLGVAEMELGYKTGCITKEGRVLIEPR